MFTKLSILFTLLLLIVSAHPTRLQTPIAQVCGRENQDLPQIAFGAVSFTPNTLQYQSVSQTRTSESLALTRTQIAQAPLQHLEVWGQMLTLTDGSLAYLSFIAEGNFTTPWRVNVLQPDGDHLLLLPDETEPLFVLRLLNETRPNVFGVIGYTRDTRVFRAEVSIQEEQLTLGIPEFLEQLRHLEDGSDRLYLAPSPNGRYLYHTQLVEVNGNYSEDHVIYDLEQQAVIWRHPYTSSLSYPIWTNHPDLIALIGFATDAIMPVLGDVIGVYQDGRSEKLLDLEAAMGMPFVMGNGVALGADSSQVVFWGRGRTPESVGKQPLMRFNYQTGELVDLCIRGDGTSLYADPQGEYVLFQETFPPDDHRFGVVSVETGDYRYFTTEEAIYPLPNTFQIVR
ncbi:MAG: hypothetical protein MUF87_17330 [Anaerolineae bacterium]|jgi:hypothetical protein|nr:hypothetical protein [Anaerolineae bacterium]